MIILIRISQLEKTLENLRGKLESETKTLDNKVDERTIEKNSNSYDNIKTTIIAVIVTAVFTTAVNVVLSLFGK